MEHDKICLIRTQYEEEEPVSWRFIESELYDNFNIENNDFITLSFEGEKAFIQTTQHEKDGKIVYEIEVGNGELRPNSKIVYIMLDTLEEVKNYLMDYFVTGKLPDTTGWKDVEFM